MRQLWCQDGQDDGVSSGQLSPMSPPFLSDSRHNLSLSPPLPHRSSGWSIYLYFTLNSLQHHYSGVQFTLTPLSLSEGNSHLNHMSRMGQGDMYDDRDGHDESRDSESPISDVEITS